MKKRVTSLLLALCLLLSILPVGLVYGANDAAPAAPGETAEAEQPTPLAAGAITRAQWIQSLVKAFDMTVEEAHAPDNYFSDLTGEEAYYRDILVAVQFGVIDIPVGEAFDPEGAATREFAAQTLNQCLGFLHDANAGYTFSESASVTYPDAIQVAIDRGWFALSGGSALPQQALTTAEQTAMLADAAAVLKSREIDTTYENTYTFQKDVIEIPKGTEVSIQQDTVTIENCPVTLKSGDIFVVWYQSIPCAYAASAVTTAGTTTTVTATAITDGSAITGAEAQGILDAEFAQFIPAEGTEVLYVDEVTGEEYTDAREADRAIAAHQATRGTKKLKTLQLQKTIPLENDGSVTVCAKIKNPVMTYQFSLWNRVASVTLKADYEMSVKASLDVTNKLLVKELLLGFWGCPGIGGIKVGASYRIGGSITGIYSGSMCVGIEYRGGSGFSFPREFKSKGFSFVIEATLKAGLSVSIGINDVPGNMLVGNVSADFGVNGSVKYTPYTDNAAPRTCLHTAMYLYLDTAANVSYNFGFASDDFSQRESVWTETTSPVRVVHHYEDGKEVGICTRSYSGGGTGSGKYYTPGSSNYWNSGWAGGIGGTAYDANGKPIPIYEYTVSGDTATITKYNGVGTTVVIPKTIDGYTIVAIGGNAFSHNQRLTSVTIPDTVTVLKEFAFSGCPVLETVDLPDSVTELDYHAFSECKSLSWIRLPKNLERLGGAVFTGCDNLKSIYIPKSLKTADTYTSFYCGPFYESGLEKVTFEEGTTAVLANLFRGADKLKSVTLLDTMTSIGDHAFDGTALREIQIPESVTYLGAFSFQDCTALKTIGLPNSITAIKEYTFHNCTALETIELPDRVRSIGFHAFSDCKNLRSIKLPTRLKEIGGTVFTGCDNLKSICIPKSLQSAGTYTDFQLGAFYNSGLETATFEEGTTSVVANLFRGADKLKSVTLPDTMTSIGANAFEDCAALTELQIPDSVTRIDGYAFRNSGLRSFHLSSSVTELGVNIFERCKSLTEVTWDSPYPQIPEHMFTDCTALKTFHIPESVTSVAFCAFYNCTALTTVTGGQNVEWLGDSAFYQCSALKEIEISPVLTTIGLKTFQNCTSLTAIALPDSLSRIDPYAFDGCSALREVRLGNSLTAIPDRAFSNCGALESIILPYRVESVGYNAFLNDVKLTSVTIPRATTQIEESSFSYPGRLTIYGVSGSYAETYADEIGATFVAIDKPATAVTLQKTELELSLFASARLIVTIDPQDFTDEVIWTSSDPDVAIVDDTGLVQPTGIGQCTITVTAGNVSAVCTVTVGELHVHEYTATVTPPTCTERGYTTHTCTCGDSYVDTYTNALGHDWGAPSYVWAANNSAVTATRTCKRDGGHVETEKGNITTTVTKEATYEAEGEIVYTARFTNPAFTTQTRTAATPKLEPSAPVANPFTDVKNGQYYYDPVLWAVENEVTSGTSATTFSPDDGCTRAQVVTFLWRAAGQPEPTKGANPFSDVKSGTYYYKAVLWAVEKGITAGTSTTTFSPDDTCTRAQIVTFLWRFEGQTEPTSTANPFSDVQIGAYFGKAVLWAVENGITNGTSPTTFSPDDTCTRAQVVTFLYRDVKK